MLKKEIKKFLLKAWEDKAQVEYLHECEKKRVKNGKFYDRRKK